MTLTTFLAIVVAVALGIALAPKVPALLRFLLSLAWLLVAVGGFVGAVVLLLVGLVWRDSLRGLGYWYLGTIGVLIGISLGAFKFREWRGHRCPICKETLFVGEADPLDYYVAGQGGWAGVPLAVHVGPWLSFSRRQWYHQICSGVYTDDVDRHGRWYVFGFTPPDARPEGKKTGTR